MSPRTPVAILGSGHIGTDLAAKLARSTTLELRAMAGIDPESPGLQRAAQACVFTTAEGLAGLRAWAGWDAIAVVFDATSASAHLAHAPLLHADGKRVVDLTPAAVGPFVVPVAHETNSIFDNDQVTNINMVTCGGQATIPIVWAISRLTNVYYAEIVAAISSRSAGPGTRANIDEFTETTAHAIQAVGGAGRGKAIIILNPAEPPMIMRDTVYCLCDEADPEKIRASIHQMVEDVQSYVPGYRLKQEVQFEHIGSNSPLHIPEMGGDFTGLKVSIFLEVEGAAHYLPAYAGNLDIMTSAAMKTAERLSIKRNWVEAA